MNLHQLELFYAVARRRSITGAASELHLTQPAVSLQIRALERECGLLLFERGGTHLRLTQAGEALYRPLGIIHRKKKRLNRVAQAFLDMLLESAAPEGGTA